MQSFVFLGKAEKNMAAAMSPASPDHSKGPACGTWAGAGMMSAFLGGSLGQAHIHLPMRSAPYES